MSTKAFTVILDEEMYWAFKRFATERRSTMKDEITRLVGGVLGDPPPLAAAHGPR